MENKLFSPLTIQGITLRNRVVASPMLTYSANNGFVNDWHLVHLGKIAAGGAGLVFMESTKVDANGCSTFRDAGIWKDDFINSLSKLHDVINSHGAISGIQLSHSGRKGRRTLPWEGRSPMDSCPGVDHGEKWDLVGPSSIAHGEKYSTPNELTKVDIKKLVASWGLAAKRAHIAGFDVVEIHGAHGYLIHQFLSAVANQRKDEYGGSFDNRCRFALEITNCVREYWPSNKPLFFRVSAVDETGWNIEHSISLVRKLKNAGVDVIDCSSGGMGEQSTTETALNYGYQVPYSSKIRHNVEIKTMAVGLIIHADQAEKILMNGDADLIALGRELIHNPNWPIDAAQKLGAEKPFANIAPSYGYWLDKRSKNKLIKTSTWQNGIT